MLKCILIWITVFMLCFCHRSMGLGNESVLGKKYLVYFVKSPYSKADDDTWICAGAIVTPTQILTAAACLVEVERIYVIAGYKKYVNGRDLEKDNCTRTWKQKVVKISVPQEYKISSDEQPDWLNVDIGVATVQEPYNFTDESYRTHCSYTPQSILINYEKINELEKTRAIALGWGGMRVIIPKEFTKENLKPQLLQEATTTIIKKRICANLVPSNRSKELVNKYLLCASGNGFLVDVGEEPTLDPLLEECPIGRRFDLNNVTESGCMDESFEFRRKNTNYSKTGIQNNQHNDTNIRRSSLRETCQNDHGGPLVTWVGTQEMILGVALNGISNPNFDCVGPRIYVSTAETAKIIKCLLEMNGTKRKTCNDQIDDKRYQVNDIEVKWPEDLKHNSTSSLNGQKISSFRRQGNEEQPLQVRPTKDLGNIDEQENPPQFSSEQVYDPQRISPYYQLQNQSPANQAQWSQNGQFREQVQGPPQELSQELPRGPLQGSPQGQMQQQQMESQNQPQVDSYNQPQMAPYSEPKMESYNQQQIELQNQPLINVYNQPQVLSYNQPQIETYNRPQMESENLPQVDSYNQPQMASYNQLQMKSYNQAQIESFNQRQIDSQQYNQTPVDPYDQPQMDSYNQAQMESQYQLPMETRSQPQGQTYNNPQIPTSKSPQMETYMPRQVDSFNQAQIKSFKPQQIDAYNKIQLDSFKPPQADTYNPPQVESFKQPQGESFNQPQTVPFIQPPAQSYNQPQTELQSSYNHPQIESFKPVPEESYNPLEILSENLPDEDDSFKLPTEEPYKPPSTESYKQKIVDSYKQQPYKPAPIEPYEQPHLLQKDLSYSPQHEQPLDQHNIEPYLHASAQPSDPSHMHNILRDRPRGPTLDPSEADLDPPRDESQTFEQIYSELHASGVEAPPQPATEQTFEELYKTLHDGTLDVPHNPDFEERFEQPLEQQFKQTYDRVTKISNEHLMIENQDDVKVRPQVPLDYPDYLSNSRRRENTSSKKS